MTLSISTLKIAKEKAPIITGIERKTEYNIELSLSMLNILEDIIVDADRLTPGIKEIHCEKPIIKESLKEIFFKDFLLSESLSEKKSAKPKKTVVKIINISICPEFSIKSYARKPTIKIGIVEITIDFIKFRFFKIISLDFVSVTKKQISAKAEPICIEAISSKLSDSLDKNLL